MRVLDAYLHFLARRRWSALLALVIAALLLNPLLGNSLPVRAVGGLLFVSSAAPSTPGATPAEASAQWRSSSSSGWCSN